MLPRRDLLEGARDPEALEALIQQAEVVLRTYQPSWSAFLTAPQREEAEERFAPLEELHLRSDGGFPQAERRLLQISRSDQAADTGEPAPLALIEVSGNFLFDPADPAAIRAALIDQHSADPLSLGDVLVRGDRGALVIVTSAAATTLLEQSLQVRSVECKLQAGEQASQPGQQQQKPDQRGSLPAARCHRLRWLWGFPEQNGQLDPSRTHPRGLGGGDLTKPRAAKRRARPAGGTRRTGVGSR